MTDRKRRGRRPNPPFLVWLRDQKARKDTVGTVGLLAMYRRRDIAESLEQVEHAASRDCFRSDVEEALEAAREDVARDKPEKAPPLDVLRMGFKRAWKEWLLVLSGQEVVVDWGELEEEEGDLEKEKGEKVEKKNAK